MKRKLSVYLNPSINIDKAAKTTPEQELARYHDAEYFAMLGHAISGGIESPLQFMLQVLYNGLSINDVTQFLINLTPPPLIVMLFSY
jgi:hypothetical protein